MGGGRGEGGTVIYTTHRKHFGGGAGERAQQLRALAALTEDSGSLPSTHVPEGPVPYSGLCRHPLNYMCKYMHTHTYPETYIQYAHTCIYTLCTYTHTNAGINPETSSRKLVSSVVEGLLSQVQGSILSAHTHTHVHRHSHRELW